MRGLHRRCGLGKAQRSHPPIVHVGYTLILRSREAASRRIVQCALVTTPPSFEMALAGLLRMRAREASCR